MRRSRIAALVALGLAGAACSPVGPSIMGPEMEYLDEVGCVGETTPDDGCRDAEAERMQILMPGQRGHF
jgi:hypothetical protein